MNKSQPDTQTIAFFFVGSLLVFAGIFFVIDKTKTRPIETAPIESLETPVEPVVPPKKPAVAPAKPKIEKKVEVEEPEKVPEKKEEEQTTEEEPEVEKFADLYIESYEFSKTPVQGEEVNIEIKIKNKGDKDAKNFEWKWCPSSEDDDECNDDIDRLKAGDSVTVDCDYTYEDAGDFDTKFIVDEGEDVKESDEDNNTHKESIEVTESEKADLIINEYSFDPVPKKDDEFEVRIGIKNEGKVAAEDFWWEWWPNNDAYECREKLTIIAPNSEKVVTCTYTYTDTKTYNSKAVADSEDDVKEVDEDNNEYSEEVIPTD